jgi:negative regulator of flagellin synthesis FlgM
MKIGHLDNKPAVASTNAPVSGDRKADSATTAAKAAASTAPGQAASATVALSATAASLSSEGVASAEGSFDQAKVDRIAQAIRDGNYQINADAIADKLIANAQELLGKAGG